MMIFEFDPDKSASNKDKHGIDFDAAQALWDDDDLIVAPVDHSSEPRWLAVGMIRGKHWTAIFTMRARVTRLISVRRSRSKEVREYEGN